MVIDNQFAARGYAVMISIAGLSNTEIAEKLTEEFQRAYRMGIADALATATAEVDNDDTAGVVKSPGQAMKDAGY